MGRASPEAACCHRKLVLQALGMLDLNPQLSAQLADLGRDLPLSQVSLQPLSQQETLHLVQAIIGEGAPGTKSEGERREHGPAQPSMPGASPAPELERPGVVLGEVLFA